jgi:AcrR family transcriptional regulator
VTTSEAPRRPRADALRNRERVLEAARAAFAVEGLAVPLDEIARRAGVGAGTVYRHFPTKEALFAAVVVDRIEQLSARAQAALDLAGDDALAGSVFFDFLGEVIADAVIKKDVGDALRGCGVDLEAMAMQAGVSFVALMRRLMARAQDVGAVRADVDTDDLRAVVFGALAAEQQRADTARPGRIARLLCDGLRPGNCAARTQDPGRQP